MASTTLLNADCSKATPRGLALLTLGAVTIGGQPASAFDDSHNDFPTETIASQELGRSFDRAAQSGAATVGQNQRGPGSPEGLRYGNFVAHPEVKAEAVYDDNIFRSDANKVGDVRFEVVPRVTVQSDLPRHVVNFGLSGKLVSYAEHSDQDYADYAANVSTGLHFDHAHTLGVNFLTELRHEEKGLVLSPRDAAEPVAVFHNRASAGLTRDAGRLYGTMSFSADRFDYMDATRADGDVLDQDYRDSDVFVGQLRVGYRISPGFSLVTKLRGIRELNAGDEFVSSQSTGYEATAGLEFQSSPLLRWHLFGGLGMRDFDRDDMGNIESSILEAGVTWLPTQRMTVTGTASREISAVISDEGVGAVETSLSARVDYDIYNNLVGHAGVSASQYDFAETGNRVRTLGFNAGLDYTLNENWLFTLGYDYEVRQSTIEADDATDNRFTVGAKLRF